MKAKQIVVIETPPSAVRFTQVTCLMSDEELAEARLERPDLIFKLANVLPDTTPKTNQDVPLSEAGITVRGMTLPVDLEQQAIDLGILVRE